MVFCIEPVTAITVAAILSIAIVCLQVAGWGLCLKCGKAHREPRCAYCDSGSMSDGDGGDIRKPRFHDQISRRKRGED